MCMMLLLGARISEFHRPKRLDAAVPAAQACRCLSLQLCSFQAAPILLPSITAVIDGGGVCSSEAPCRSEYCQNVHSYVCLSCASTASLLARAASPYLGLRILHT